MQFTIYVKDWIHGEGAENSFLVRPSDQKKCCLGFRLKAQGISDYEMLGVTSPSALYNITEGYRKDLPSWMIFPNLDMANDHIGKLFLYNDGTIYNLLERMMNISRIFAEHGDEVHWVF